MPPGLQPQEEEVTSAMTPWGRLGDRLFDVVTLGRCGMLTPGNPLRVGRQLVSLATWDYGLAGELRQAALRSPSWPAVIDEREGTVTYRELYDRSLRACAVLRDRRHQPGSRIGLLARNHVGAVEVMAAVSALGADLVLLNPGLSAPQLARSVEEQQLDEVIHDAGLVELLAKVDAGLPRQSCEELGAAASGAAAVGLRPPVSPGRTVILTSGTTGAPKGARRQIPSALAQLTTVIDRLPIYVGDRILVSAPIFHTWGYGALQIALALRCAVILQRRFHPAAARCALDEYQPQAVFAVPVMLQRMLEQPGRPSKRARRSLRVVATSGSALPSGLATRFMDAYGDVLYNLYGSTEASWVCIAAPADLRRAPVTVGTPPRGTRVAILGSDGRPVPEGSVGQIFVANDLLFEGYTSGPGTDLVDGMVATGDLGHIDGGLFFVDGRVDDMVVSGGENVYPGDVESTLASLAAVREVAVVGVPDAEFGQRLAAYIVLADGAVLTADEVRDRVRATRARHSVPRDIVFVGELPRNLTGKVLSRDLRDGHGREHRAQPEA